MLQKRTNILFDEDIFRFLSALAAKKGTSVGSLVRNAVSKVYIDNNYANRDTAYKSILKIRKSIKKIKASEIKEFIDYGRKN